MFRAKNWWISLMLVAGVAILSWSGLFSAVPMASASNGLSGRPAISPAKAQQWPEGLYSAFSAVHPMLSGSLTQTSELTATVTNGTPYALGSPVSLSGDGNTALIGASVVVQDNNTESYSGGVYIYTKSAGSWTQTQVITATDAGPNELFGSAVSLSSDGSTAIVGAPYKTESGQSNAGAVYVFTKSGGSWTQTQKLTAADGTYDEFGYAVSLSSDGSTILVGAPFKQVNGLASAGAAYIYTKSGGSWSQSGFVTASDEVANDNFGLAVSLSGDGSTALISIPDKKVNDQYSAGVVYIFTNSGSGWSQVQKVNASDPGVSTFFGTSVSLSNNGNIALIGANGTTLINGNGAAYVFTKSGNSWVQTQKLAASDGAFTDNFGTSVSLSGDGYTAIIGAPNHKINGQNGAGAAYIFNNNGSSWNQAQELNASDYITDASFGRAVGLSSDGNTALIASPYHKVNGNSTAVTAYIFTPPPPVCQPGTGSVPTNPTNAPYVYYLPFLACGSNNYTTYLAFQNTSSTPATVTIQYFNPTGGSVATPSTTCTTLAAFAECIAPNPFTTDSEGTGVIYSSQPLNVIISEATPYGGSAYAVSAGGSNNLTAPIVIKGGLSDFTTNLTIFNGGSSTVTGTVQFYQQDGTLVSAATKSFTLTAATSLNYNQSSDSSLGNNFYGWAQITSPVGSKLVAQVLEQSPSQHFVALANAQPASQTTLSAPAIFKDAYGAFNTGMNIINPNSQAVTVTISYYNKDGTTYTAPAFTLAAYSLQGIYQGGNTAGTGLPTGGLPDGFAGAAVATSVGGGVVMAVNEFGGVNANGNAKSGTYSATANSSNNIGLPVVANGGYGYTTGATIFNSSSQTVSGTIQYYNLDGTTQGAAKSFTVGAYQSLGIYQGDPAQGLPSSGGGFYGTAVVTENGSGKDLVVTTNAASSAFFYSYTEPNS